MVNVSENILNAVTSYDREFKNTVALSDGVHSHTFDGCDITVEDVFSDEDNLAIGKAFSRSVTVTIKDPVKPFNYNQSSVTVTLGIKTGESEEVKTALDIIQDPRFADFVDLGTLEYRKYNGLYIVDNFDSAYADLDDNDFVAKAYCNSYSVTSYNELVSGTESSFAIRSYNGSVQLVIKDIDFTGSASEFTDHVSGIDLYYELAEPNDKELSADIYETVNIGTFYCAESTDNDGEIELTAYDKIADMDVTYVKPRTMTLPTTVGAIVSDIASKHGITTDVVSDRQIYSIEQCTEREMLGYMAGLTGQNAVIDRNGVLTFRGYGFSANVATMESGIDQYPNKIYTYGIVYDVDREHQLENGVQVDGSFKIKSVTSGTEESSYTAGSGKGLTFSNPYITKNEIKAIYGYLKDFTYYTGSVSWFGNPAIECGDMITVVDKDEEERLFLVSSNTWNMSGGLSMDTVSADNGDSEINFSSESPTDRKINALRTSYQEFVAEQMNEIRGLNGGIIRLEDTNEDGINDRLVACDNTNTEEAKDWLIINAEGIGLSSTGEEGTFVTAITKNGINADSIYTGTLSADHISGGTLSLGGDNDEYGSIVMYNGDGVEIGQWGADGLLIKEGVDYSIQVESTLDTDPSFAQLTNGGFVAYRKANEDDVARAVCSYDGLYVIDHEGDESHPYDGETTYGDRRINTYDGDGVRYTLIRESGSNMWIGTAGSSSYNHRGRTYISTGYNQNEMYGNSSIKIFVPNEANNGGTSYDAFHAGYCGAPTIIHHVLVASSKSISPSSSYGSVKLKSTFNKSDKNNVCAVMRCYADSGRVVTGACDITQKFDGSSASCTLEVDVWDTTGSTNSRTVSVWADVIEYTGAMIV